MISKPFLINCLINGSFYFKALVDTGCLCYSVFDENLVRKNNLHTVGVTPRKLTLVDGRAFANIEKIAKVELDINGMKENLTGYVMPNLAYLLEVVTLLSGSGVYPAPWLTKTESR